MLLSPLHVGGTGGEVVILVHMSSNWEESYSKCYAWVASSIELLLHLNDLGDMSWTSKWHYKGWGSGNL